MPEEPAPAPAAVPRAGNAKSDPEDGPLTRIDLVPISQLVRQSLKRTYEMFIGDANLKVPDDPTATERKLKFKYNDEYKHVREVGASEAAQAGGGNVLSVAAGAEPEGPQGPKQPSNMAKMLENMGPSDAPSSSTQLSILGNAGGPSAQPGGGPMGGDHARNVNVLAVKNVVNIPKPVWHPPWKLMRVISGHEGWVRCLAVDPTNEWFVSGSADRLIKIWDLATGTLKLSLTGHVSTIRALAISDRHPYLFSASEDNEVKCWDLEQNQVIRQYHGHLSGVYSLTLHPTLNVLASGGRDSVVRVWDMRTKEAIFVFGGHTNAVCSLASQAAEPQFISGSMDHMVRLWDLAAGKCSVTLTNHKKSIRALAIHPNEYTFVSCAADNNKVWKCPRGAFDRNISGHHAIVNACAIKSEGDRSIMTCGTDDGFLHFWDWRSGHRYQTIEGIPQPGSLSSENGIYAMAFDQSQSRLITGECDKTIKFYKEDPDATEETHPINWKAPKMKDRALF